MRCITRILLVALPVVGVVVGWREAEAGRLDIQEGDHICIIGGGVADSMQHSGWLETLLQSRFPQQRLVIRNLAYDGDEIELSKRLRSADFGTPDQWLSGSAPIPKPDDIKNKSAVRENRFELTGTKADVIFAFFGSNEAHAGPAGLDAFKRHLEAFIKHTLAQKYNGVDAPKLVLFSPIAHEDLNRPHWTDGKAHNTNLALYTDAMEAVCLANGVQCVDLFTPTQEAYAKIAEPLTTDGIHPNERGDREISRIIDESLFGVHPARDPKSLARLQKAVADKNFYWFNRYRVTDGYSTYGGRAWLKFVDGQTNYEVAQRELDYLDVKTANRDRRIWAMAAALGATAATLADPNAPLPAVDDVGLPELIPVVTNKPGSLEGGKHAFLSGRDAIGKMTVHSGMTVELVADEGMFPELINPVQMSFDTKGRLWVAAWPMYPHWRPDEPMNDKLLILEDTNGDGKTDRVKTFAGDLHNPIGFEFWGKGVIVSQGPGVVYLEDTDGDDRYDVKTPLIGGLDTADTHHTSNSFTLDPAGALYFQEGVFHHSQGETPWGPPVRCVNGAVFRYEPRTGKFGLYTSYSFANPHGHAFDRWGDDIVVDGTMSAPYWGSVFSTRLDGLDKHANAPTVYKQRTRPCPAIEIVSSPHFPADMQGNLLVGNVISMQGILQYKFQPKSESFPEAVEIQPLLSSSDPNFRPADIEIGPDGAIYFCDWQNPIIGHMQHNLRDPSRDRLHGRVYRIVMADKPLVKPVPIADRPVSEVVALLSDPTDRVRYRTRLELSGRPEAEVVPAVKAWLAALDRREGEVDSNTVFDLIRVLLGRPKQELVELRGDMERLATGAKRPVMRRIGYVGLINIDAARVGAGGGDASEQVWKLASDDPRRLVDLIEALPLVGDPAVRASLYERIAPIVDQAAADAGHRGVPGRLVRIELTGSMRTLWLDEVEVYAGDTNLARTGRAAQKPGPNAADNRPDIVIDGKVDPKNGGPRPGTSPEDPWWEVDLGSLHPLTRIVVRHKSGILGDRLKNFKLVVLDDGRKEVFATDGKADESLRAEIALVSEAERMAAVVRRAAFAALAGVRGRETETFKKITPFVKDEGDRDAAIRALAAIPVAKWPAEEAAPLLDTLIDGMKQASAEARASDAGLAAWQFAENLTTLLPAADGKARRSVLADLGVRVVKIGTVYERMAYDKETIAVQAGKPVLFVLENADVMPHNFVITKPGRMQALGELAEVSAQNPAFAKQNFVPQSPDVLVASTLMQPQGSQRITFNVPTEPGVYPYVCTYPGHWRRMFGAMYVVDDLEAYHADPAAYLASHPLVIKDDLLKDRRPRTEWTLADLEGSVLGLEKGRSFVHGRELFRTASCISCHKMGDAGNAFGPELAKLEAKMTPLEITKHILEPSLKIDEKYRSTTILTDDGLSITGLVVEETPTEVAIVENPVAKADPVRIKTSDIDERSTSPVSIMPKGLLDKLTRDEVLDLIAYVAARGQESNCLFNPDGCPHHGK